MESKPQNELISMKHRKPPTEKLWWFLSSMCDERLHENNQRLNKLKESLGFARSRIYPAVIIVFATFTNPSAPIEFQTITAIMGGISIADIRIRKDIKSQVEKNQS